MKTYVRLALCGLLVLIHPMATQAQDLIPVTNATQNIEQDDIKHLIETLESDTARKDFIGNLKLLLDTQKKNNPSTPSLNTIEPLTEQIGIRAILSNFIKEYEGFLNRYAISSSIVHQFIGSLCVVAFSILLYFGVRRATFRILNMVDHLSVRIGLRLSRFGLYAKVIQLALKVFVLGLCVYTLGKIWNIVMLEHFFESDIMRHLLSSFITFLLIAFLAALIWEAIGMYLSYILKQADDQNQMRVKTLLPLVRKIVMSIFSLLLGLILLSELGINVGPLLAGAGVLGVAIGFGAQSMVKDFLTGFTIVLEDILRVGDVATLGGYTGVVEKITLRKVQLRDVAGIVYSIPFSEISIIQNMTKDFSFHVIEIGVAYSSDIDKVMRVMRKVDDTMRADSEYSPLILDPIEIFGLDRFAESAVIIKARIKTIPAKQWDIGREFNRRLKLAFEKEGIEIPFPHQTLVFRKESVTPPLPI